MQNLIFTAPHGYDPRIHYISGVNTKFKSSHTIFKQLVRVGEVGLNTSSALAPYNLALSALNIGATVASFLVLHADLKRNQAAIQSLASKLDARHRDQVLAGVGSVLDVLELADEVTPERAMSIVESNLAPLFKELRLLDTFVDELKETRLSANDFAPILRLMAFSASLKVKMYAALGEYVRAEERALDGKKRFDQELLKFVHLVIASTLDRARNESELRDLLEVFSVLNGDDAATMLMQLRFETGAFLRKGEAVHESQLRYIESLATRVRSLNVETLLRRLEPDLFSNLLGLAGSEPLEKTLRLILVPHAQSGTV